MWDAIQQVNGMHPSWSTVSSTHFVDRSIHKYCPVKPRIAVAAALSR